MNTAEELKSAILRMDHRGCPAFKSLAGSWRFPEYVLNIDHVQEIFTCVSRYRGLKF